jgi:hypothetical protein
MNEQEVTIITTPSNMSYPRHAGDRYRVCPFKEITAAIKDKMTGTRCSPNCVLFNVEVGDCNINIIALRLTPHELQPVMYYESTREDSNSEAVEDTKN